MKKCCPVLLLTLLTITLTFCNKKPLSKSTEITAHDKPFPVTLRKGREKKIDTVYLIGFVQLEDANRLMVSYFAKNENLYRYILMDSHLNVESEFTLARGQGPLEIGQESFAGGTVDVLFIYDGLNRRVMFCGKNFKNCRLTRKALHKEDYTGGFGYSPDTGVFLMAEQFMPGPPKTSYNAFFLRDVKHGTGGERPFHRIHYKKIERDLNGKTAVWVGSPLDAVLIGNFAYIINLKDYTVFKYDLKGRLIKSIRVRFPAQTYSKSQMAEFKAAWGENKPNLRAINYPRELWPACWLLKIGKGLAVARRKDHRPSSEKWITADYFDLDLNYLGKIRLPAFTDWNHPNYSRMAKSRDIFCNGEKLYILRQGEGYETCTLEEWNLDHDK